MLLTLHSHPCLAASQAQQDHIKMVFGRLLAVGHDLQEAVVPVGDFQRLVEDAAAADMFAVWPFRGSSGAGTNRVTAEFYLPDVIHSASLMQRFDHVFPYMELLFSNFSASSLQPNSAPCLHEALSLLAEVHDLPQTSQQTKMGIARLMQQWGIMRLPVINEVGVWSSEPQPSRIGSDSRETVLWVVGSLQAQRQPTSDCSPTAVQQLVAVPPHPFPVPADTPQVCNSLLSFSSASAHDLVMAAHAAVTPINTAGCIHSHAIVASNWCITTGIK